MRDIETIINRIKCDLPITNSEREFAHAHLDKVLRRQQQFSAVAAGVLVCIAVLAIILTLRA
jgi:hypothetical protein